METCRKCFSPIFSKKYDFLMFQTLNNKRMMRLNMGTDSLLCLMNNMTKMSLVYNFDCKEWQKK